MGMDSAQHGSLGHPSSAIIASTTTLDNQELGSLPKLLCTFVVDLSDFVIKKIKVYNSASKINIQRSLSIKTLKIFINKL